MIRIQACSYGFFKSKSKSLQLATETFSDRSQSLFIAGSDYQVKTDLNASLQCPRVSNYTIGGMTKDWKQAIKGDVTTKEERWSINYQREGTYAYLVKCNTYISFRVADLFKVTAGTSISRFSAR